MWYLNFSSQLPTKITYAIHSKLLQRLNFLLNNQIFTYFAKFNANHEVLFSAMLCQNIVLQDETKVIKLGQKNQSLKY